MVTILKGGTLWAVVAIVLAVLGAATFLAQDGVLSGADWLVLGTAALASVGIVTGAHVASQAALQGLQTPVPGTANPPVIPTVPGTGGTPAMPVIEEPTSAMSI